MRRISFGAALRAARCGYHWSDRLNCWVKISPAGEGRWRVDMTTDPKSMNKGPAEFVRWWDDPEVLDLADLWSVYMAQSFLTVFVNDDGQISGVRHPLSRVEE